MAPLSQPDHLANSWAQSGIYRYSNPRPRLIGHPSSPFVDQGPLQRRANGQPGLEDQPITGGKKPDNQPGNLSEAAKRGIQG